MNFFRITINFFCVIAINLVCSAKVGKEFLEKQRKVLTLFNQFNQPSYLDEHLQIIKTFKLEDHKEKFEHSDTVDRILEYIQNGYFLPKGDIWSVSYIPEHFQQAAALFDLLYFAKDFDTFYKTAVLSRHLFNEGLFLHAYSTSLVQRKDCYGIILPPIWEINPHYFYTSDVINEAYKYKQAWDDYILGNHSPSRPTIIANYSGHYLNLHPEQGLMSYYLEDVGVNNFYYYFNLYYPSWMNGTRYLVANDQRGRIYYHLYQQMLQRFYLERLSNNLGQIPILDWEEPAHVPYYPALQYPNGLPFPERARFAKLSDFSFTYGERIGSHYGRSYSYLKTYLRRHEDAIDNGYVIDKEGKKIDLYGKDGFNIAANVIQANADSPNRKFYGHWIGYARHLLGYSFTPLYKDKVVPSVLEHWESNCRDPAFYQIYKNVMDFFYRYQSYLPPYEKKDLIFEGIVIKKIAIDPLVTFFEEYCADLSQAVFYSKKELKNNNKISLRSKQYRLNQKPFTIHMNVTSAANTKAVVKISLGAKYDEFGRYLNLSQSAWSFFELDKFIVDLKKGNNTIKRESVDFSFFGPDKTSYNDLVKQVDAALKGEAEFTLDWKENYFYFPRRYMLPKGTSAGFPYQFHIMIYPFKPYLGNKPEEWTFGYPLPGAGGPYIEDYQIYYPFDRPIKFENMFINDIPNGKFHEQNIYFRRDLHKSLC